MGDGLPSVVKTPPASAGNVGSIPGLGRFPGEGNGNPLQYSCLRNPMEKEPVRLQSMRSQSSQTSLSDYWQQQATMGEAI